MNVYMNGWMLGKVVKRFEGLLARKARYKCSPFTIYQFSTGRSRPRGLWTHAGACVCFSRPEAQPARSYETQGAESSWS